MWWRNPANSDSEKFFVPRISQWHLSTFQTLDSDRSPEARILLKKKPAPPGPLAVLLPLTPDSISIKWIQLVTEKAENLRLPNAGQLTDDGPHGVHQESECVVGDVSARGGVRGAGAEKGANVDQHHDKHTTVGPSFR